MSTILIDRDLLQRILDAYFDEYAENQAYFLIEQRAELYNPDPERARQMRQQYRQRVENEKAQISSEKMGLRIGLREKVLTEADASFLPKLWPPFAPRSPFQA
jgi:hypothetical protein